MGHQINHIYWTHNPSTGHIRIRIHGIHLIILYIVMNSPDLFLSVFGTETNIYNNGSIDVSDTFKLLFCPENAVTSTRRKRI